MRERYGYMAVLPIVIGLCTLPDEQISHTVLHELCLLVSHLHRHRTHRRPPNSLATRRSIDRVVLVALDVRLHVLGRHQPYIMAEGSCYLTLPW